MALDPADRDLLKIYSDPSLSPADKLRLLGGDSGIPAPAPLPPSVAGLPPGAVAGPGGGAGGTSGADDSGQGNTPAAPQNAGGGGAPSNAGGGGAPSMADQAGATTGVTGGGTATPVTGATSEPSAADQRAYLEKNLSPIDLEKAKAEHPELYGEPSAKPEGDTQLASLSNAPPQPGNGDYRGALRLLTGGPVVPMEKVQQSTSMTGSSVDPGQIAALDDAAARRDYHAMQASAKEAQLAQQSGDVQLAADKQAQAEREALSGIRNRSVARVTEIRDRQNKISDEIINTKPVQPDLWAGKNFGESLLTLLSVAFLSLGAAGTGDVKGGMQMLQQMANREVDKQQRELEAKKGALNDLGTVLERHMANYHDLELAKQQTIADIYGKAAVEIQQMRQDAGGEPNSAINQKLAAQQAALEAARKEQLVDIQAKLGPKVEQQETVAFARKHVEPKPGGAPAAPLTPSAISGKLPVKGALPPAPAPTRDASAAINHGAELWAAGHAQEALSQLPPTIKTAIIAQAQRSQKGLGEGATREDSLAYALHDVLGWKIPESFIPQSAREKLVQIPGGSQGFATGKAQADKLQEEFNNDQSLVSAYQQLLHLAEQPASAWSPETRSKIDAITSLIRPMTAHALGQRGMSSQEQELFDGISGHDINGVRDFLLGTGKAAAQQALQIARTRIRSRARSLSRDPFDFVPIEGGN